MAKTVKTKPAAGRKSRMPPIDAAAVAALDETLGDHPELRPGKMFGCPAYFLGAKAVACVFGGEINLTLPPAKIDELVKRAGYRRFEVHHGRFMSGWVLLSRKEFTSARARPLLGQAIEHARAKAAAQAPPRE